MTKVRTHMLILGAVLVAMLPTISSHAAVDAVTVSPPGQRLAQGVDQASTGYVPAILVVSTDGSLTYVNGDPVDQHNIISNAKTTNPALWDMRYCPSLWGLQVTDPIDDAFKATHPCSLFYNFLINGGQSAPVYLQMPDGTPKVQSGTVYTFYCEIHHNMTGTLVVSNA